MLTKGALWTGPREPVIPNERKYHLRNSRVHDEYRPTISFIDRQRGVWEEFEAVYTTRSWTDLVEAINDVAREHTGQRGGTFYVNEFKQVIKPVGTSQVTDIYVGEYPDLHFQFDCSGQIIDNSDVSSLSVGDDWPHQKVGIRYHYSANRRQVFYRLEQGNVIRRIPIAVPKSFEAGLWQAKDHSGGQFYINEHGHAFAPKAHDPTGPDVYIGSIDVTNGDWFEKTLQ